MIAEYDVRVGGGQVVKMTGDPDKIDIILNQMKRHDSVDMIIDAARNLIDAYYNKSGDELYGSIISLEKAILIATEGES